MVKSLFINPANRLPGENFNSLADMRADIPIRASIGNHVPWNVIDKVDVTESKRPTS